jgi:MFS family permease
MIEEVTISHDTNDTQSKLKTIFVDLKDGYLAVVSSAWLWITILIFGLVNATSTPVAVALPILTKVNLQGDVQTLGFFTTSSAIGFVLGSIVLGNFKRLRKRGLLAYLATCLFGLMIALFGLVTNIPILIAAAFFEGVLMALFGLIWTNSLQELVPHHLLGRVASIDALGSFILLPIGYGISGWATDLVGAPLVFVIGGALTALLALLGLLHPAVRHLD